MRKKAFVSLKWEANEQEKFVNNTRVLLSLFMQNKTIKIVNGQQNMKIVNVFFRANFLLYGS